MSKTTKAQSVKEEYIKKTKKEYTVKVTTIAKFIVIVVLLGASFVAGWNSRSDFEGEVRSQVTKELSVQASKE